MRRGRRSVAETLGSIIDYVQAQLEGFVTDAPVYATLTNTVQADDLEIPLTLPEQAQPQGLIEIGNELIHVQSFNTQSGLATIPAWGRGQQGTTAAAHTAGSKVVVNPRYPRKRVAQVINHVVAGMCPPLFAVQRGTILPELLRYDYELPVSTRGLLRAEWRPYGDDTFPWQPVHDAVVRRDSGVPVLRLDDKYAVVSGEVRYTVSANPVELTSESQLFSASGLPESCVDIVSLGAIPRLVTTAELARQQLNSVEVSERATLVPAGSGAAAGRFYMQMYEARLLAETKRLRQEYPITLMRNA